MAPIRIQDLLERAAEADSDAKIIAYYCGKWGLPNELHYGQLLAQAKHNSKAIRSLPTWRHGSVVLVHLKDQLGGIIWFWSVLYAGSIPAMSAALSNNAEQKLEYLIHIYDTLEQPICITSKGELYQFAEQDIVKPVTIESLEQALDDEIDEATSPLTCSPQDPALLMLTSGSTSKAKAVCLSHEQLIAAVYGKSKVVELPKSTAFLNWIAMDHVASLVEIHLQALYLGMDQVHVSGPDVVTDPTYFLHLVDHHRVSRTFAPNFFLAKLKSELEQKSVPQDWDLSCLRYIASGGEANATETCVALDTLLQAHKAPSNIIIPGFGMTETCAGSIFNTECPDYDVENGLEFLCLGHCMPGIEMRITTSAQSTPAGVAGDLEVRGPVVFQKYFNNPEETAAAFTEDGWFKTGDQGLIDASGYLRLTGRAKDIMIVNGVKYSPKDVETAISEAEIEGVTPNFTIAFSSWSPRLKTEEIHILYLPSYPSGDGVAQLSVLKAINREVIIIIGSRPTVLPVDDTVLHRTSLGKLSRGKLKAAFEKASAKSRVDPTDSHEERVLEIFLSTLDVSADEFDVETPIFDMGITSIQMIELKRKIEQGLELASELSIGTLIHHPTVRDLAAELQGPKRTVKYDPVVTLQPVGTKTPLWLIHPGVGEVLVFLALAKYVTGRRVYALRARGFSTGESCFQSIDEAVDIYHKSIKERQPTGPYAIAGYSYGTMLAFEVAKTLEHHGDKVAFCGSFNLPPHIKSRMRQLDWNECLLHLSYFLRLFSEQHSRDLADESKKTHSSSEHSALVETVFKDADQARLAELSLTPAGLVNWASLAYSLQSMAVEYEPSGGVDSIDVFYCTPLAVVSASRQEWLAEHLSKWRDFSRSEPRFHEVQGEHYTMLDPDNVYSFQHTLKQALKARGL